MYGQDRMKPSTWRIDALYRAVCWQIRSEEREELLALALDQGAHPDSIAKHVKYIHWERRQAHEAFVEHTKKNAA